MAFPSFVRFVLMLALAFSSSLFLQGCGTSCEDCASKCPETKECNLEKCKECTEEHCGEKNEAEMKKATDFVQKCTNGVANGLLTR